MATVSVQWLPLGSWLELYAAVIDMLVFQNLPVEKQCAIWNQIVSWRFDDLHISPSNLASSESTETH